MYKKINEKNERKDIYFTPYFFYDIGELYSN